MQEAIISITAVASDKEKHQKLNFFANGKISNLEKVGNIQFTKTDMGSDFLFSLSENMEFIIEQSNTKVSVEKELKRFHKKFPSLNKKEKIDGFINCVKGTYDFIYGVSGENEIEFSKDKLFTGIIISDGGLKAISTNYNSIYKVRKGSVENIFIKPESGVAPETRAKEENYSPSVDVIKEYNSNDIKPGDLFIFATTNANAKLDKESIETMMKKDYDAEETSWRTVEKVNLHGVEDNFIVMTLRVDATRDTENIPGVVPINESSKEEKAAEVKKINKEVNEEIKKDFEDEINNEVTDVTKDNNEKKQENEHRGIFTATASIFKGKKDKKNDETDELEDAIETDDTEKVELVEEIIEKNDNIYQEDLEKNIEDKDSYKSKMSFPGLSGDYRKVNKKRPVFMKRRMNIYFKRFISIIIVLLLMAGIVYGMIKLLNLIFTEKAEEIVYSPTPTATATPTPTPSPTPTPTATPTPTPTATPEPAYVEYTVQSGDTLSKISALFYDGDSNHVAEIVAFNENITDPSLIRVGQVIKIPTLYSENPEE